MIQAVVNKVVLRFSMFYILLNEYIRRYSG